MQSQIDRMKNVAKMKEAECFTMSEVYSSHLDAKERARIERLEMFDEFEEWNMLQSHYCLSLGKRIEDTDASSKIFI